MRTIYATGWHALVCASGILFASAALADWQPVWSTPWQHPTPFHSASPWRVRVAADGATFAVVDAVHDGLAHIALMRFEDDGQFAWLQEHAAASVAGIAFVGADRVAIAGDDGNVGAPIYIRLHDVASGALIWEHHAAGGRSVADAGTDTPQVVVDASGNLMVLASDHGDFVVIRLAADGTPLPTWRRSVDASADVLATALVALADGGVAISGRGRILGGGNITIRLDALGQEVFTDVEVVGPFPYGPAFLGADGDGNLVVAAAQETANGSPLAQVWKLSPSGQRLWTRILPNPLGPTSASSPGGFALTANGDALVELDEGAGARFRVVRLAAASGEVLWDSHAPIGGTPSTMALAANGRLLVGGSAPIGGGHVRGRIVEFDASGEPCRVSMETGAFSSVAVAPGAKGWAMLGATTFVQGLGNEAFASRFDADGPCSAGDPLFADGFEPIALPQE
ncbi:MAG: hypothetical protein KF811_14095 [Dokdonella sp.]|nr:hypothetical protein [Dokdonella sp.]MCB1571269.1 hypothetical protein [Xanthomonadales bacterium]MCB1576872.1 hypothetical protein [Xanthomonadales bacterium]